MIERECEACGAYCTGDVCECDWDTCPDVFATIKDGEHEHGEGEGVS